MPDSDARLKEAVEDLIPVVEEAVSEGAVLLEGPASVQLVIEVEEAQTPEQAVAKVLRQISDVGFGAYTFAVTDKVSGRDFFVRQGRIITMAEILGTLDAHDENDD